MNINFNKRKKSAIVVYAIVTLVFIVISLVIPFSKSAASWMMFAFSIVALLGGCGITLFAFSKSEELKSKFYGYPLFRLGFIYTAVQLALTLVIYIIGAFVALPYWVGLTISILILGLAAIGLITVDNARDYVEEIDVKTAVATKKLKKFNLDIADILDMCKDEAVYPSLKKLAEKIKYSDPVSTDETADIEEKINLEIDELQNIISTESTDVVLAKVEKISTLLSSRNRSCEQSKK